MRYAIGVDVGGTKIEAVLVNDKGRVLERRRIQTPADQEANVVLERIAQAVEAVKGKRAVVGVGVALPGCVVEGRLTSCPNIPSLAGRMVEKELGRRLRLPIVVENDAKCFALAEQRWGAGKGKRHVVGLIIGTGIGAGIIIDGKIYAGATGGAGECGHIPHLASEIEAYAAGPGMFRHYRRQGGRLSSLAEVFKSKSPVARKSLEESYDALGLLLAIISRTIDPELIVLGGGVSNGPIISPLRKRLAKAGCTTPLAKNALGDSSGSLGAAHLALERRH